MNFFKSAIRAAAAYRIGIAMKDHRQGLEHDYSNRTGVLYTELICPEETPEALRDRAALWNAVEAIEKRKDAQLAREITVALPHELTDDQRRDLVRGFVQEAFVDCGMIADLAIHAPGREGDQRNHHAHLMLTTRRLEADGFGPKERSWNAKDQLIGWREGWADLANAYLRELEHVYEIDHRTLEAQREEQLERMAHAREQGDEEAARIHEIEAMALDRDPLPDIGWQAWGMERRGIRTSLGDLWRDARSQLDRLQERVAGLYQELREALAERLREMAGQSLAGLSEALRGADLSGLERAGQAITEREEERRQELEREEKALEYRQRGLERDDGGWELE